MKNSKRGISLIETLVTVLIVTLLSVGIGVGINSGLRVYQDSAFLADSGILSDILNTSLEDALQFSNSVTKNPGKLEDSGRNELSSEDVPFVFTNYEYGIRDGYFWLEPSGENDSSGILQIKNLITTDKKQLINTGAYPNLGIRNFKIEYFPPDSKVGEKTVRGDYFSVSYQIYDKRSADRVRDVTATIRVLNPA